MAKKEIVNVITIKTEESQNTIKGLKKEIADLKKNLDNAVIGSDEFEKASKDLAKAQNDLKTVLADGKKQTDNVEGSYNHLVSTMAELKKEWKATADEVKRNDLAQQIDAINTELKDMDASIGNFQRNVGDYANSFKEAFDQQQRSTENVRIGLDGLQKTAAGLASGYAAVQGIMNLLNIENSNFEKAMIKVQSAMAIAQGVGGMKDLIEGAGTLKVGLQSAINGVKGFIKSLGGVKTAIAATGIGLLVVIIGTVVANWDKLMKLFNNTNPIKKAQEAVDALNKSLKYNTDTALYKDTEAMKIYTEEVKKAAGNTELLDAALKKYQKTSRNTALQKVTADLQAAEKAGVKLYKAYINLNDRQRRNPENEVVKAYTENLKAIENYKFEKAKIENEIALAEQEKLEERRQKAEQENQAIADSYAGVVERIEETWGDAFSRETEQFESDKEILKKALDARIITYEEYTQKLEELIAAHSKRLNNLFEDNQENQQSGSTGTTGTTGTTGDTVITAEEYIKQYGALFDWIRDKSNKTAAYVAIGFTQALSSASQIVSEIQAGIDTTTEDGFEKNKKFQKANALINMANGIIAAIASAMQLGPVIGPIIGGINAATVAAVGGIQISNINKQEFDNPKEGDNGTGAIATPSINLADSMPVQYTRDLLTDSELSNINQEQRVYVTETDISNTQNKVRVAESNSSF